MAHSMTPSAAWRNSVLIGATVLGLSVGAEAALSEGPLFALDDATPGSAHLLSLALDEVTPQLPLTQMGSWLGHWVLEKARSPSQCG